MPGPSILLQEEGTSWLRAPRDLTWPLRHAMAGVYPERSQNPISFLIHPGLMTAPGFSASPGRALPCSLTFVTGLMVHALCFTSPQGSTGGVTLPLYLPEPRMWRRTVHRNGISVEEEVGRL